MKAQEHGHRTKLSRTWSTANKPTGFRGWGLSWMNHQIKNLHPSIGQVTFRSLPEDLSIPCCINWTHPSREQICSKVRKACPRWSKLATGFNHNVGHKFPLTWGGKGTSMEPSVTPGVTAKDGSCKMIPPVRLLKEQIDFVIRKRGKENFCEMLKTLFSSSLFEIPSWLFPVFEQIYYQI